MDDTSKMGNRLAIGVKLGRGAPGVRADTSAVMYRIFLPCSLLCGLLLFIGHASADEQPVATTFVAFRLDGVKPNHRITLDDLEIAMLNDSTRLVPLLRLVREFGLHYVETPDSVVFTSPDQTRICIFTMSGNVYRGGSDSFRVDLLYGPSDFTGNVDLFLPESEVGALLSIQLQWIEDSYAYSASIKALLPIWSTSAEKKKSRSKRSNKLDDAIAQLPVLSPTGPSKLGDPSLHMLQPGLRVTQANEDRTQVQKSLGVYGRLAGGRYSIRMRQSGDTWSEEPVLDRFSLMHRIGDIETSIGDAQISLSDVMFPSGSVTGFYATGLLGMLDSQRAKDNTNFGRRDNFQAGERVTGWAPVGSSVELYVNNKYVADQFVTTPSRVDTTIGRYEFEEVSVTRDRISEVRVVTTAPDGQITERVIEPVGTNVLLRRGQMMFNGLGGVRRFTTPEVWITQGQIFGGRALYGVTSFWTLGGGAVVQSEYSLPFDMDRLKQEGGARLTTDVPRESHHAMVDTRLRLFRAHTLEGEFGVAESKVDQELQYRDPEDSLSPPPVPWEQLEFGEKKMAGRARLNLYFGKLLRLQPLFVHYDSAYFNGGNAELQDRQGYAVESRVEFSRRFRLTLTHGELHNNLEGNAPYTVRQRWEHVGFPLPRVVWRTNLRFSGYRFEEMRDFDSGVDQSFDPRYLGKLDLSSTALRVFEATGNVSFGDELQERQDLDLLRGMSLPNATSSSRPGWTLQLSRRLMESGRLSLQHSKSDFREQSRLAHILQATNTSPWHWRHEVGWDWTRDTWYFQTQPEYYFERTGASRISAFARYLDGEWLISAGLRLEPIISFVGGRPILIPASRVNPSNGGIKGRVFLDANGNGRSDHNEPGIAGIEVLGDGGRKAVSGRHGEFLLPGQSQRRQMKVSLNPLTLPVDFTPTGGTQTARLEPGMLTPVRLAVTKLGAIMGIVSGPTTEDPNANAPIGSVRVVAYDTDGNMVQESITYIDGSFYLGELKPGKYMLDVDRATLPKTHEAGGSVGPVVVSGESDEALEIMGVEIKLLLKSAE